MTSSSEENEELVIRRKVFTEKQFKQNFGYKEPVESPLKHRIATTLRPKESDLLQAIKTYILGLVPILHWLPRYRVKKCLVADIIGGLSVGIMHVPQGMSYALIGEQHPIYGLYTSFLPVIFYSLLGTSRHTSMGTSSVTCLILGSAMVAYAPDPVVESGVDEAEAWKVVYDRRIVLASACMFFTGVFLLALRIIRAGKLVVYLSDPMIAGFSCGISVQILILQLKSLLGLRIGSYTGPLNLIWILRDIILALTSMDESQKTKTIATAVISVICITVLLVLKKVGVKYKEKFPLGLSPPGEMIVISAGTGLSYGIDLAAKYGIDIIGDIPIGIAAPVVPAFDKLPSLAGYAIPIAIIGYSFSISAAKILGNQYGYEIRPNQELVAYGVSNTVCSFFSCFPAFASLSRSCVQADGGGKTQVAGLVSSFIVLLVLLVVGPLFSSLPTACLASIIFVALIGLLRQSFVFTSLWNTSKLDSASWLVATLAVVFLDVVYGLCAAVSFALLCVVFRAQLVEKEALERIGNTEFYRKIGQYRDTGSDDGLCVVAFRGPLIYLNKEPFRRAVSEITEIDPVAELAKRKIAEKKLKKKASNEENGEQAEIEREDVCVGASDTTEDSFRFVEGISSNSLKYIIIDCTQISFMDSVGAKVMGTVTDDFKKIGIDVLLANCSSEILRMLSASGYFLVASQDTIFVSVHDAAIFSHREIEKKQNAAVCRESAV